MRVPGGNALHGPAAAIAGKLFLGQCDGKAYPHRPVPAGNALQHIGRKGQIPCALRQGQHLCQRFAAAGRASGGIAAGKGRFFFCKRHGEHGRHAEQMHAVLAGVQVGQHKAGLFAGDAQQHRELIGRPGQLNGHAALAAGRLPQLSTQLLAGQQHRAAHQRDQNQQRRQQRCPERSPTSTAHGYIPPFGFCIKLWPAGKTLCRKGGVCR